MYKKYCPLCNAELALKQINLSLAVYICVNCPYPRDNDLCTIIERKIDDIDKPLETQKSSDWLDEFVDYTIIDIDGGSSKEITVGELSSIDNKLQTNSHIEEFVEFPNICNQLGTTTTTTTTMQDCDDFSNELDRILDYLNCN